MQNNSQLKFWKWALLLLAMLNFFLLASTWLKQNSPLKEETRRPPNGEKAAVFLIEELKFSGQQTEEFEKLKTTHHEAIDSLKEAGKKLHRLFFDKLKTDRQDTAHVHKLAQAIAYNQTQIEMITFTHFQKVRALCDQKQKIKFDEIIQEVLRRMAAPHDRQEPPSPVSDH
jgi:hypothetical protein